MIFDGFYGKETPLFPTMVGSNQIQIGEGSPQPTDTQHTPTFAMPPLKPKKTQKPRQPKRKTTKVHQPSEYTDIVVDEAVHKEGVTVCLGDGPRLQDTMRDTSAHTRYDRKVPDLEDELKRTKIAQQTKIDGLERRVKKLEKKHSSSDDDALDKKDASKQGRIDEIDADKDITLEGVVEVVTTAKMIIDAVVDDA
nr:hypothetical protein [Tanacetum cinerariifolium]